MDEKGEFRVHGPFFFGAPYLLYVFDQQGRIVYLRILKSENVAPAEPFEITIPEESPDAVVIR